MTHTWSGDMSLITGLPVLIREWLCSQPHRYWWGGVCVCVCVCVCVFVLCVYGLLCAFVRACVLCVCVCVPARVCMLCCLFVSVLAFMVFWEASRKGRRWRQSVLVCSPCHLAGNKWIFMEEGRKRGGEELGGQTVPMRWGLWMKDYSRGRHVASQGWAALGGFMGGWPPNGRLNNPLHPNWAVHRGRARGGGFTENRGDVQNTPSRVDQ